MPTSTNEEVAAALEHALTLCEARAILVTRSAKGISLAVRGEPAPKVLRRQHVRMMKEGSLFIDMSIDEGGCSETSRGTTPEAPIYEVEGVRHICIPNLPSEVARTASRALGISLLPYLVELGRGVPEALASAVALRAACSFYQGKLVSRSLRRFVRAPLEDLDVLVPAAEPG
jgi:alanine dehydrogenase